MSVLIKGMEMPKNCYSCNFCQYYAEPNQGCYCLALFVDLQKTNFVKERLPNCPLVQVPPHGRLIDADVLKKSLSTLLQFPSNLVNGQWIVNTIREQPTVIESEGE